MKYLSKSLLIAFVALLLCWQLPWCYNYFFLKTYQPPFAVYSSLIGDFALMERNDDKQTIYTDLAGSIYTRAEFDSILPFVFARQLMAEGRFPDSLHGHRVTPKMAHHESFLFRTKPSGHQGPSIGLYPLLESASGRVDLELPSDVFRFTDQGIEFVEMATNELNVSKSRLFSEALTHAGFCFPASLVSGDPNPKKEYDEGYLLLDGQGGLFHLKQVKGLPYVHRLELPAKMNVQDLFITELNNRRTLGLMAADDKLYAIRSKTYEIVPMAVERFDAEKESLLVVGNPFDWTVRISSAEEIRAYALRATDFSLIKSHRWENPHKPLPGLRFTSSNDRWMKPRLE
ncbi:MAG: DUF4857 domain-containing protein [Bacteroides sp.]|nr:DUF4857 domain-containing protein [Bacteroides sp.]